MKTNRTILKISGGLAILTCTTLALADGSSGSHGGNAVVCFDRNPTIADILTNSTDSKTAPKIIPDKYIKDITSVTTVDLDEAQKGFYGDAMKNQVSMKPGESSAAYIERVTQRFSPWLLMNKIKTSGEQLIESTAHLDSATMIPANDINPMALASPGCVYSTVAKQIRSGVSCDRRLLIDDRLFKKMSPLSQTVLILHEDMVSYANCYDPTLLANGNTQGVRNVVAALIAKDISYAEIKQQLTDYEMDAAFAGGTDPRSIGTALTLPNLQKLKSYAQEISGELNQQDDSALHRLSAMRLDVWAHQLQEYLTGIGFFKNGVEIGSNPFLLTTTAPNQNTLSVIINHPQLLLSQLLLNSDLQRLKGDLFSVGFSPNDAEYNSTADANVGVSNYGVFFSFGEAARVDLRNPPQSRSIRKLLEPKQQRLIDFLTEHGEEISEKIRAITTYSPAQEIQTAHQQALAQVNLKYSADWISLKMKVSQQIDQIQIPSEDSEKLVNYVASLNPFNPDWKSIDSDDEYIPTAQIIFH
jgi:hypothetical protein